MTTYGTVQLNPHTNKWVIDAAGHVRAALRRFFVATQTQGGNLIQLDATPANARNIEWFISRYPLAVDPRHLKVLTLSANAQRQIEEDAAAILQGTLTLPPIELTTPLRHYQAQAFDLFRTMGGMMCADEMGLGKTAVGAAACADLAPALVVCNTHMSFQWRDQLKKFASGIKVRIAPTTRPEDLGKWDVIIVPYTKLNGWRDTLAGTLQTVVFDEMQELRKSDTIKHAAASHIASSARRRLGLTGTPIYNYGGEIFSTMNILRPGELGTEEEFIKEWCVSVGSGKYLVVDPMALRAHMVEQGMMIRRRRVDVGRELPPITKVKHTVPFTSHVLDALKDETLQLAQTILSASADFTEKGEASRMLNLKLRQATGIAKAPFVAQLVIELAREGKGEKIVLGAWHREVYEVLMAQFRLAGLKFWMYTGSESPKQKHDAAQGFIQHDGPAVFIMSMRSGAGLDGLQHCCNTVVYAELDWSPQVHDQLSSRVARDGQENGTTIIYCTVEAGSDPIVASVLGIKAEQHQGLVNGEAMPDTIDHQQALNHGKLLAQSVLDRLSRTKLDED